MTPTEQLLAAANALGDYLVARSKVDDHVKNDETLHRLVEDLHTAVRRVEEAR